MKISKNKIEKISEQIIETLYLKSPNPLFTSEIAQAIARDEEFIRTILNDLESKKILLKIDKNSLGKSYLRRSRWTLSDQAYTLYKSKQGNFN